jgi:hypothetical protein
MNKYRERNIIWTVFSMMVVLLGSCNNDSVSEQQATNFLKYYALGIDDNAGKTVLQTSDGYAILCNFENVTGQKNILLVFTDAFGRRKSGSPIEIGNDQVSNHGYSMIEVGSGFLISGSSTSGAQKQGYLVNVSSDGRNVLWERNYGGYQELEFRDAALATDGNLIITGYSRSRAGDDTEAILYKVSETGDSVWLRSYLLSSRNDVGKGVLEYQNRYHVLTTSTDVSNTRLSRIRMLNTNTDGRAETNYEIQKDFLTGEDIAVNTSGNLYILGNYQDPVSRKSTVFLAELTLIADDIITDLADSASISDLESLHAASFSPVGGSGLAIGGWRTIQNDNDILFLQVDVDNNFRVEKRKTFGSNYYQASRNIIYTDDEGFALTGSVDLGGGRTSMLLKIDRNGELQ